MDRLVTGTARAALLAKAAEIRLVLTDVDGVLTDGGVYYSARGEEMKRFNIRDGMGVERLRLQGIETGIVTGELSESVKRRAEKLHITELHLGIKEKLACVEEIARRRDLPLERIAYIGDDVNDREVLERVGIAACPSDAFEEVRKLVGVLCQAAGGQGAFRELAEWILQARSGA
jgi:3-deoxy-D-manno-octulosonate 8-phosphate phosphatase (KDO 8-P phosphatase)